MEALRYDDRLVERVKTNSDAREGIEKALGRRGLEFAPSQTNFVLFVPQSAPAEIAAAMLEDGVIVRPMGPWIRVSVGTTDENKRFVTALDRATSALSA